MKILLTGGTGFLGSYLTRAMLEHGYQLIILKRSSSDTWRIADVLTHVKSYDIDRVPLELPFQENKGIDAVIHTATCYGRKGESASHVFEANLAFPLKLLEIAILFNITTFFNTATVLNKYLNYYALTNRQFEDWGKIFSVADKISFINLRLQHIYGPLDDESKFTAYVINRCIAGDPELNLTPGEQKRDFIFVEDVVSAYLTLLDKGSVLKERFLEFDIGSGKAITIREFIETVHRLVGSKTLLRFGAVPYRKGEIMFSQANIEALRKLGWSCTTTLSQGLQKIIKGRAGL